MWSIHFWKNQRGKAPVKEYIENLSNPKARGKILAALATLREVGMLPEPHSRAVMGVPKLRELQIQHPDGLTRIFYSLETGKRIILWHAFTKKTPKTPRREIAVAVSRLKGGFPEGL